MADKDALGRAGEERAARDYAARGYAILDRNWRCPDGELDLVVARDGELVAVEVKTRRGEAFGHPLEAIDAVKQRRLWRLAAAWQTAHAEHARGRRLRLDAIGIIGPDPAVGRIERIEGLDAL